MQSIIIPGTTRSALVSENFDSFLLNIMRLAQAGKNITIDLRGLPFIDLLSSIGVLFCCVELLEQYKCTVYLAIDDAGACRFLPRLGFFRLLDPRVSLPDGYTRESLSWADGYRGMNRMIVELTSISDDATISAILDKVIDVLVSDLRYPQNDAYDLAIVFSELCHNVLDHAGRQTNGLAAMQIYQGKQGQFMQFVVADQGPGVKETLRRNPAYASIADDVEAIVTSLQPQVSEHNDIARGNGLSLLVDLVLRHGGRLHFRSGRGKVYVRADRREGRRFNVAPLGGMQISVTFPSRS